MELLAARDLTCRGAAKKRERYLGAALGAAVDMKLASEATYTFANVEKAEFLGASSLIVKQGRIKPGTAIGDDDTDLVWPQMPHRDVHGTPGGVLHRI